LTPSNQSFAIREQTNTIEINKRKNRLGHCWLKFERPTITESYLIDWKGPQSIEKITFSYANRNFYEIYGENLYRKVQLEENVMNRTKISKLQRNNLSLAERKASGAVNTKFYIDLRVLWSKLQKILRIVTLSNKIRVDIEWTSQYKAIVDAISGTVATYASIINDIFLYCEFYHRKNVQ
jgi:hypothetical protein